MYPEGIGGKPLILLGEGVGGRVTLDVTFFYIVNPYILKYFTLVTFLFNHHSILFNLFKLLILDLIKKLLINSNNSSNVMTILTTVYMNLFQELSNLPLKCIYGFVNETDKRIYIGYSSNILNTLSRKLMELKSSNNVIKYDWDKLDFKIIEEIHSSNNLRIRYEHWVKEYNKNGYQMYREYKAVNYKLRIEVLHDVLMEGTRKYRFYVKIVSRGSRELIVGIFDNKEDMDVFIELHYKSIDYIIYANNNLTKEYLIKSNESV